MTTQGSAGLRVKIPVPQHLDQCVPKILPHEIFQAPATILYVAAVLDLCSGAARVGLKSGTVRYHGTVVTVILFATDVDLLESSSQQSLFCRGFANCVCGVRDVARLGIL